MTMADRLDTVAARRELAEIMAIIGSSGAKDGHLCRKMPIEKRLGEGARRQASKPMPLLRLDRDFFRGKG